MQRVLKNHRAISFLIKLHGNFSIKQKSSKTLKKNIAMHLWKDTLYKNHICEHLIY